MGRIGEKIRQSLELGSEAFRRRWENDPVGFLVKHCGRKYPPKIRKFFEDLYFDRVWHALIKANRGGGKTVTFADLATCKYLFKKWDSLFAGGSEAQAKKGYNYAANNLDLKQIEDFNTEILKTLAESQYGNKMNFVAASQKQVRGPHLGSPNKKMDNDMQPFGGLLIIDEECEADDDIVIAVKKTVNTARPGQIVRGSTLHKLTGSFAKLCEDPGAQGATLYEWDCFDTAQKCVRKCPECRYEFAGKKRPGFAKWRKAHPEWNHERGYCEGKGKKGEGWREIFGNHMGTIERSFITATCLEEFEVEEMGWRPAAGGQVLNPVLLDKCLRGATVFMPGMPTIMMVDWGLRSWAVIHVFQQQKNRMITQIQTEYYHETRDEIIYMRLEALQKLWSCSTICADGSHPYQNENLKYKGFDVEEVSFNQWKDYGAAWIKGLLEQDRLWLQGEIINGKKRFMDTQTERFFKELKGWRKDKNGKIVKKDDHGPDALLCGAVRWGKGGPWKAEYMSSGKRKSMEMVGAR